MSKCTHCHEYFHLAMSTPTWVPPRHERAHRLKKPTTRNFPTVTSTHYHEYTDHHAHNNLYECTQRFARNFDREPDPNFYTTLTLSLILVLIITLPQSCAQYHNTPPQGGLQVLRRNCKTPLNNASDSPPTAPTVHTGQSSPGMCRV